MRICENIRYFNIIVHIITELYYTILKQSKSITNLLYREVIRWNLFLNAIKIESMVLSMLSILPQ